MDQFLASVERRAFRMAEIATSNRDEALDIVQDAMFALVKNYRNRNEQEWGALFHRIMQSKIHDWYRRTAVKRRLQGWLQMGKTQQEDSVDALDLVADEQSKGPFELLQQSNITETVVAGLKALPLRQQQAFLLRAWEGLSVSETAQAMSCSEGSVKTHYARALMTLRAKLEAAGL